MRTCRVEGGGVGDGLDRGAGLALGDGGIDCAVDGRIEVIGAADHGQHLAALWVHHHHGPVMHVARRLPLAGIGQLGQPIAHDAPGRLLHIQIKRGVDSQALGVNGLQPKLLLQLAAHVHHEVGRCDGKGGRGELKVLLGRQIGLLAGEIAVLDHQVQHHVLALLGGGWILQWVVDGGRLGQPGQQRAFRQIELSRALGEVDAGGRLDPVGQIAVIALVQVKGQNLILGVASRQTPGQD